MIFPGVPGVTILVVMIVIGDFIPVLLVAPVKMQGGEKKTSLHLIKSDEKIFK